ncbi:hypothetical protein EDB19DRAFT_1917368 [Suillus lakei]|nr:hypothetical protein EDB19DRAFT_1917368 [Suillus lakei]
MSTPVDTTLTRSQGKHCPYQGHHLQRPANSPGSQPLCSDITGRWTCVKEHGDGPLPGIVLSCSKELMRVRSMSPQVWPDWFSIGHDDPRLLKHPWHAKVLAWEALGDDTFDLPVAAPPSTGPSTNPTTEYRDKGKGKAVFADPEAEAEGSRKRKSPMISEPSSQPPKSAMKSHKRTRLTHVVKSKPFVESEDDDQPMIKPFSGGVPEVVLPRLSTIIARTPNSPCSPWVPTKQPYGPATAIAGSCPAGIKPPWQTPEAPVQAPPVIDAGAILIPGPVKQPMPGLQQARLALRNSVSPPESALPPLIDLSMAGMAPTPPTPEDASPIEGLVFEDNVVHPEDPHTSGEHVDPGNPGNLVPEYDSADDMDVEVKVEEVKVEPSSEETAMAT